MIFWYFSVTMETSLKYLCHYNEPPQPSFSYFLSRNFKKYTLFCSVGEKDIPNQFSALAPVLFAISMHCLT